MRLSRRSVLTFTSVMLFGGVASWYYLSPLSLENAARRANPDFRPTQSGQAEACTVAPLVAVTDPTAVAFETGQGLAVDLSGLTPRTAKALTKFEEKVTALGGSFQLTSAFRPASYQQHLRDVWYKWMDELKNNEEPACASLKAEVQQEFIRHGLLETQHPVAASDHTKGTGFDAKVTVPVTAAAVKAKGKSKRKRGLTLDSLARMCGLRRPNPSGDRVHFRCIS